MNPVSHIEGVAAPLLVDNISTDIISPSALLASVHSDLGKGLFGPWRYHADGSENADFVLNQPRYRAARILLAGRNFGCGSSREHAVWCLSRFGIACVIAPSFGEIFTENAFKNALVPIVLDEEIVHRLAAAAADPARAPHLFVDIAASTITAPDGSIVPFSIGDFRRTALLEGLDELDLLLREGAAIDAYQARVRQEEPWRLRSLADIPLQTDRKPR